MLETVATCAVLVAWTCCTFTVLQLVERRARGALVAVATSVGAGLVLVATRNHELGFAWLRSTSLRSDAFALAALPAAVGTCAGTLVDRDARRSAWGPPTALVSAFACAVAGVAALAVGRASWYWEFVAVIVAGGLLVAVGVSRVLRRDGSPTMRLAAGCSAAFGAFLVVGGAALLVAWRALA